jgi:hypothetical protein
MSDNLDEIRVRFLERRAAVSSAGTAKEYRKRRDGGEDTAAPGTAVQVRRALNCASDSSATPFFR